MRVIWRFFLGLAVAASCAALAIADDTEEPARPKTNPYLARKNLKRPELVELLANMRQKPLSIRKRPGFAEAMIDAADRILAESKSDESATGAIEAKFAALHFLSLSANEAADKQLRELSAEMVSDKREKIAALAKFYGLEQQALEADALPEDQLAPLLETLEKFFSTATLEERHLRLASLTVRVINRLPDDKLAAEAYRKFGALFAKSKDAQLARYGRKIEQGTKKEPPAEAVPAMP